LLESPAFVGIACNILPGLDRIAVGGKCLSPELQKGGADEGVFETDRTVGVPGKCRAPRTSPGFVIRESLAAIWIVGGLGLPDDDPVFYIDIPGAGAGAIDTVGGAHLFIVLPPVAIKMFPGPLSAAIFRPVTREFSFPTAILGAAGTKKAEPIHEISDRHHSLLKEGRNPATRNRGSYVRFYTQQAGVGVFRLMIVFETVGLAYKL
jgi:hypothetical protein